MATFLLKRLGLMLLTLWILVELYGGASRPKGPQTNKPSARLPNRPGHRADTPLEPATYSETTPKRRRADSSGRRRLAGQPRTTASPAIRPAGRAGLG